MKKRIWTLCLLSLLSLFLLAGCGKEETENNPNFDSSNYLSGTYYAMIELADYDPIYLELYADAAPATVTNFVTLVKEGFYDGLTFHRIIDGFMMQGGDPNGDSTGGSTYEVPGEFALNGFNNPISHVRGTISMARTEEYDSASSQFFIVQEDSTSLDGVYAGFGKVVGGMDVVDNICFNAIVEDENGTVLAENQPVILSISMIEENEVVADTVETEEPEVELPAATAVLDLVKVNSVEDIQIADNWTINENGTTYLFSSSKDLLSLGLYESDFASLSYNLEQPLAYSSDIGANEFLSIQISLSEDGLSNLLLVAEEHNGALGRYLLNYDDFNDTIYLVPIY